MIVERRLAEVAHVRGRHLGVSANAAFLEASGLKPAGAVYALSHLRRRLREGQGRQFVVVDARTSTKMSMRSSSGPEIRRW